MPSPALACKHDESHNSNGCPACGQREVGAFSSRTSARLLCLATAQGFELQMGDVAATPA